MEGTAGSLLPLFSLDWFIVLCTLVFIFVDAEIEAARDWFARGRGGRGGGREEGGRVTCRMVKGRLQYRESPVSCIAYSFFP